MPTRPFRKSRSEAEWLRESWDRLEEVVDRNALGLTGPEMDLLKDRWFQEAKHYDKLWRALRRWDRGYALTIIVLGATTTFVISVGAPNWLAAAAGAVVAISGGIQARYRFQERWLHQRHTADVVKAEGLRFLERREPYDEGSIKVAFRAFLSTLEQFNESEAESYVSISAAKPTK